MVTLDNSHVPHSSGPVWRPVLWVLFFFSAILAFLYIALMIDASDPKNLAHRTEFARRSLQGVVQELGLPTFARQMTYREALDLRGRSICFGRVGWPCAEYASYEVHQRYAAVQIKELIWKQRRTYLTVWFCQKGDEWIAITGAEWNHRMRDFAQLEPLVLPNTSATQPRDIGQ